MYEVEELGAIKFDMLGLRHLDTLMEARNLIFERHGVWLDYRGDDLPPNLRGRLGSTSPPDVRVQSFSYEQYADPNIWPQMHRGETTGIFQLETPELTRTTMELQPWNEVDVAALISIIRPGVKDAGLDKVYLQRRRGEVPVVYDHPLLEPIAAETYGVLVYQEQLMKASRALAGFTAGEADTLRSALGKKKADVIAAMESKFMNGCMDNKEFTSIFRGSPQEALDAAEAVAHKVWVSISAAGRYAFNKSHAVEYAVIPTWEVWTKHYYPQEMIVACMVTDSDQINRYIREARRKEIKILPPDINESDQKFTIGDGFIRYGLDTIRGVGPSAVKELLAKRPFSNLAEVLHCCDGKKVGKTQVEALIKIGAMDSFENWQCDDIALIRTNLMNEYHEFRILEKVSPAKLAKMDGPAKLAHIKAWREKHRGEEKYEAEFVVPDFTEEKVIADIEAELVGNYITRDPIQPYVKAIEAVAIADPAQIDELPPKSVFVIGGMVSQVKVHQIKKEGRNKGRSMAFIQVQWNEQDFDITVFPDTWDMTKMLIVEGTPVACQVKRDDRWCNLLQVERLDLLMRRS
jgi:DNA polymerase-3 subunit alpha